MGKGILEHEIYFSRSYISYTKQKTKKRLIRGRSPPTAESHYEPQRRGVSPRARNDTSAASRCAVRSLGTCRWSIWSASTLVLEGRPKVRQAVGLALQTSVNLVWFLGDTLPFDPNAMSWLLEERLKHVAQWGKAIFLMILYKYIKKKKQCYWSASQQRPLT